MSNCTAVKTKGFTLIEMLIVISIIGILISIILPSLLSARAKARQSVCLSNLRQLGIAIDLYSQDYDDLYPYGADVADLHTTLWLTDPRSSQVLSMPLLKDTMASYVKQPNLWRCPSDNGYDNIDLIQLPVSPVARPTAYDRYGMSYIYNISIALDHIRYGAASGYDPYPTDPTVPPVAYGPSQIFLLADTVDAWHGDADHGRFSVLMADNHAVSISTETMLVASRLRLQ